MNTFKCQCGAESAYGGHGISHGAVYDIYLCETCYLREKKRQREGATK